MKTKKLVIVGDSAFAEIALEYFEADSAYEVVAFSVERAWLQRHTFHQRPVVPYEELERHFPPADHEIYVAIPYTQFNRLRTRLAVAAKNRGYRLASYVSSHAFVWRNVEIGEHVFIFEDNTLQPFVRIGDNVVLWSGSRIGHHSVIRDNCFISLNVVISGFCDIGENSFIGVNATISNNVQIGADNWIGPSTTLMKNSPPDALYITRQPAPSQISATRFFKIPGQISCAGENSD